MCPNEPKLFGHEEIQNRKPETPFLGKARKVWGGQQEGEERREGGREERMGEMGRKWIGRK
jgi:hypothetical protein